MPDTYIPDKLDIPDGDFVMGLFQTNQPERFGVVFDGQIYDKSDLFTDTSQLAWGFLSWSKRVADYWIENLDSIQNHTQAFNMAMKRFGYNTFYLDYYYDVSCFEDYKRLLNHV